MKRMIKLLVACGLMASTAAMAQQPNENSWSSQTDNYTGGRLGIGQKADTAFLLSIRQDMSGRYGAQRFLQLTNSNRSKLLDITGTTYGTNGALSLNFYQHDNTKTIELNNNGSSHFLNGIRIGDIKQPSALQVHGQLKLNSYEDKAYDFFIKSKSATNIVIEDDFEKGTNIAIVTKKTNKRVIAAGADTAKATFQLFADGTVITKNIFAENIKTDKAALLKKWPDYVFDKKYELRSINEVEQYITKNGHLPDVPSKTDVTANGVDLGEMNAVLLKKVEELTLYMIQLQKQNEQLQQAVNRLEKK